MVAPALHARRARRARGRPRARALTTPLKATGSPRRMNPMRSPLGHAGYVTPGHVGPRGILVQVPAAVAVGTAIPPTITRTQPQPVSDWLRRHVDDVAFVLFWLAMQVSGRLSAL